MTTSKPQSASAHPATGRFDYSIFHAETRAQWRRWLTDNHPSARAVWSCSWRTGVGGIDPTEADDFLDGSTALSKASSRHQ